MSDVTYTYNVNNNNLDKCPLCGSSLGYGRSFDAPLKIIMCKSKRCKFATWNIFSPPKNKESQELNENELIKWKDSKGYKKHHLDKQGYWVYVLRSSHSQKSKQTYYIGQTKNLPIYRLLQHSLDNHDTNSSAFRRQLKQGESPYLIETIGPFRNRIEAYIFESLIHKFYENKFRNSKNKKKVLGDGKLNLKNESSDYFNEIRRISSGRNEFLKDELQTVINQLSEFII